METTPLLVPGSWPSAQHLNAKLSDLPDELLTAMYTFNAAQIFDADDLSQYLCGARSSQATRRCAWEALCRSFGVPRDIEMRDLYRRLSNVEIWTGSYSFYPPAVSTLITRTGGVFSRFWSATVRHGLYLIVAAQGNQALSAKKVQMLSVDETLRDSLAVSFHLQAAKDLDMHAALNHAELLTRGLPELRTVALTLELCEPEKSDCLYLSTRLDELIAVLEDRGCSISVKKLQAPTVHLPVMNTSIKARVQALLIPDVDDSKRTLKIKVVMLTIIWISVVFLVTWGLAMIWPWSDMSFSQSPGAGLS